MDEQRVVAALDAAERALAEGRSLDGTGFWKAVQAMRVDASLASRHAERVGRIDRAAFEAGVKLRVPGWMGTVALSGASAAGVGAVALSRDLGQPLRDLVFLGGVGVLLVSTHSLAHEVVGRMLGMRFTHYFLGGPPPPRPGAKTDYATYLLVPPDRRAVMHASGAVVTKAIPFIGLALAGPVRASGWVRLVLLTVGVAQIVTDAIFSTKTSDWKKARREWRAHKRLSAAGSAPTSDDAR